MKKWSNPELNVLGVRLSENIAASDTEPDDGYEVLYLYYDLGGITRGGVNYRCKPDQSVQDTEVKYTIIGSHHVILKEEVGLVAGCIEE